MKKKLTATLLSLCMTFTLLPTTVFATNKTKSTVIPAGDTVYFGSGTSDYSTTLNEKGTEWIVLKADTKHAWLFAKDVLCNQGDTQKSTFTTYMHGTYRNQWMVSDLHNWLNNDYLTQAFTTEEQTIINNTSYDTFVEKNKEYGGTKKESHSSKMFLLDLEDVQSGGIAENYLSASSYWWLRTPGNVKTTVAAVNYSKEGGIVHSKGYNYGSKLGVRPSCEIDLSSVLFASAAENGKPTSVDNGMLSPFSTSDITSWKLTIKDNDRADFTASLDQSNATVHKGETIKISYNNAKTGDNEYVSAVICDENGNMLYYGKIADSSKNAAASDVEITIPSDLTEENFKLYVFSEQCNGNKKTDYASDFQQIDLKILLPEAKPNVTFTATGDSTGTLSPVSVGMKYSVDGEKTWTVIDNTTGSVNITDVTAANDVKVYMSGNGTTTSDSEVCTIDVTQAVQPTSVSKQDCTTTAQNDGKITGVNNTMEYKVDDDSVTQWTPVSVTEGETSITVSAGKYLVRVKADKTVLASPSAKVTVGEYPNPTPPVNPINYPFLSGKDDTYTKNSDGSYTVKIDADLYKFTGVEMDERPIDAKNYSKESGSTIITFSKEYMNTLAVGSHTLTVNFTDGTATTTLTVKEKATATPQPTTNPTTKPADTTSPQTGDNSNIFRCVALLFVSGGIVAALMVVTKKRRSTTKH